MAFSILYSIRDAKNQSSTMQINVPAGTAFSDVQLFAREFALLLDPCINGVITRVGVSLAVDVSTAGLAISPDNTADVEEGARFQFRTAGGYNTAFRIPTFLESKIATGSKDVNTADTDIAAIIAAMTAGIDLAPLGGGGTVAPTDPRGDDVAALTFAREAFQNSRS